MSDDTPTDDPDERPEEEQSDQPELEEDDYLDVPDEVAEQVAAEDADDTAGEEAESKEGEKKAGDDDDQSPTETLTTGTSVGDLYCNALGMGATLARDRKGSGVTDREEAADDYADMARQLDLDDFVDEWMEAHGGTDDLSPGQGIAIGTTMFALAVMVDDPDLADDIAGGVGA